MAISEWTKAAITTKGAYYPPGRNPPAGERKLCATPLGQRAVPPHPHPHPSLTLASAPPPAIRYLVVEGESEASVKAAKKEIKRILDEASADAAPDPSNRYAKYSI